MERLFTWQCASAAFLSHAPRYEASFLDCCCPLTAGMSCSFHSARNGPREPCSPGRGRCARWRGCGSGWVGQTPPNARSLVSVPPLADRPAMNWHILWKIVSAIYFIQWGHEYRTLEYWTHYNIKCYEVLFSNGLKTRWSQFCCFSMVQTIGKPKLW